MSGDGGGSDRRTFLKKGALLSAAAAGGLAPSPAGASAATGVAPAASAPAGTAGSGARGAAASAAPDPDLLRALAEVVLPSELGDDGRERAVRAFERWLEGYEPAFEVNHGYGTHEIVYGPAHPGPGWEAQLQALDIEARKRTERAFDALPADERRALVERQLRGASGRLPSPARAGHVAVGLLAHWAGSGEAHDLAYRARIGPQRCRGLQGLGEPPAPLP